MQSADRDTGAGVFRAWAPLDHEGGAKGLQRFRGDKRAGPGGQPQSRTRRATRVDLLGSRAEDGWGASATAADFRVSGRVFPSPLTVPSGGDLLWTGLTEKDDGVTV